MKRCTVIPAAALGLLIASLALPALAADDSAKGKEMTITGEATCAKCALHETKKCQTVIQTKEDGKTVTYYLTGDKAKDFHDEICKAPEKATATGVVTTSKDGKEMMKVSKIEAVK